MLHPVEIVPTHRAALRRGVRLGCEITTNVHGPRRETLVDLSPRGARVVTDIPMERGQHVLIAFAPENLGRRVETIARVAHVDREPIANPSVGLEFEGLDPELHRDIHARLRNVPPPLPTRRAKPRTELVWLDVLVTWEEDLGDRVNTFEVSDTLAAIDDGDLVVETLAPFVTGGAGPYRWLH
jgi:hypothetical protein